MTVNIPSTVKGYTARLAAEITVLAARTDTFSQQRLKQQQEALVATLMAEGRLSPASILATVPYNAAKLPAALASAITYATTTAAGTGMPAAAAAATLSQLQAQAVHELMAAPGSGMSAATILSTMSYVGGAGAN